MTPDPTTLIETCDICMKPLDAAAAVRECRCSNIYGYILLQSHRDYRANREPTPIAVYVGTSRLDVKGGVELPSPGERFITLRDVDCDDDSTYEQVEVRLESVNFVGFSLE